MEEIKDGVSTALLIGLIHLIDKLFNRIGESAGEKILCKMGDHDWEDIKGSDTHRYCTKCGTVDDKTTEGIDHITERKKRWIKRVSNFREWRNERKRRRETRKQNNTGE